VTGLAAPERRWRDSAANPKPEPAMTTSTAHSPQHVATAPWLRRLLRTRADRLQNLWSTLLVLATMVACVWIAMPEASTGAAGTVILLSDASGSPGQ
jgi:hypothetical protein